MSDDLFSAATPDETAELLAAGWQKTQYAGRESWRSPKGDVYQHAEDALAALRRQREAGE